MAPRKVRKVADLIRGCQVEKAIHILTLTPQAASRPLKKLLESAVANAEHKGSVDVDTLRVKKLTVDQGATLKRWLPRAQGRATPIRKKTSHISVILEEV